jgi:RimJ/RimL family protein N-acetyltransferase
MDQVDSEGAVQPVEEHPSLMVGFDTPRLHLRPIGEADEALYCQLYTDPNLMRHIAPPMLPAAALRSFQVARRQQSTARQRWIACRRGVANGIGLVGLFVDKSDSQIAEVGVMLLAAGQGAGFGTEAMAGVIDRAFSMMPLRRVWIRQSADNAAVPAMMRKLGFEPMPSPRVGPGERYWQQERNQWKVACREAARFGKPTQTV